MEKINTMDKMIKIIHRINTIEGLKKVPREYGVEIDVRGFGSKLLLTHDTIDPEKKYDELEEYLDNYNHRFIIFNIKEAGYENRVIKLAEEKGIEDYFLLDVEFPYLYSATRKDGFRKIAVRFSEAEPIEAVLAQKRNGKSLIDWVWIDTNTKLPLDKENVKILKNYKTCLVCPERWGRPEDIKKYKEQLKNLNFKLDAVMTSSSCVKEWGTS
jgi:hypothetical protein